MKINVEDEILPTLLFLCMSSPMEVTRFFDKLEWQRRYSVHEEIRDMIKKKKKDTKSDKIVYTICFLRFLF